MKKIILVIFLLLAFPLTSYATLFTVSSGDLAASADFSALGGNLQVILTNTSPKSSAFVNVALPQSPKQPPSRGG